MTEGPKSVTLRNVVQSPRPSVLTVGDADMKSKASVFAFRDVRSRASMVLAKDGKSHHSTYYRDLESRISKAKEGHKSRTSSTHKEYGAFVRKGRTDLSSASRELLRRRLHSTGFDSYGNNTRQTSRVAGMEELPDAEEQQQSGELGQLFTVLRPTRRDAAIIYWPKDVLIQKFYRPHDQRHAMPLSIGPVGVSDMFGETGRRKSFHIQGPATSINKNTDKKRLHSLLGEFYKDKKYLDNFIDKSGRGSDERFFAERGRDFLYNLAGYWDNRTPLGERPPTTNLGLRLARSQTCVS